MAGKYFFIIRTPFLDVNYNLSFFMAIPNYPFFINPFGDICVRLPREHSALTRVLGNMCGWLAKPCEMTADVFFSIQTVFVNYSTFCLPLLSYYQNQSMFIYVAFFT